MTKLHIVTCFGELLELAESHGFDADSYPDGDEYTPRIADALEEDAREFLVKKQINWVELDA